MNRPSLLGEHGLYPSTLDGHSLTLIKEEDLSKKRQQNSRMHAQFDETRNDSGVHKDQRGQLSNAYLVRKPSNATTLAVGSRGNQTRKNQSVDRYTTPLRLPNLSGSVPKRNEHTMKNHQNGLSTVIETTYARNTAVNKVC